MLPYPSWQGFRDRERIAGFSIAWQEWPSRRWRIYPNLPVTILVAIGFT
jgi:hypothetical protein